MPIPRQVLSDTLRKLLSGRRVTAGVFTTYTFEPQFFEEEIVSLLSDEMVSAEPKLRMLQLEELLRSTIGPLAVYYDRGGLRGDGAARLDIRYLPVHLRTGVFHPKVILLLTKPSGPADVDGEASLICGILSANITKTGWWSLLECAHFEIAEEGQRCSYRQDLIDLLKGIRGIGGAADADHRALDAVLSFVGALDRVEHATLNGRLRPRIVAGTRPLAPFLDEIRGDALRGATLEVISPFFDEHNASPLRQLVTVLKPKRAFVYLPRNSDGSVACSASVYEDVSTITGANWAQFKGEDTLLRIGKDKHAKARSVHAKVYRFTDRATAYESLVVGSHNLTTAATGKGGNFEASYFVEVEAGARLETWLETDEKRPKAFDVCDPALESSMPQDDAVVPLQVKFNWEKPRTARLLWDADTTSPTLQVALKGAEVLSCDSLPPRQWKALSEPETVALESVLVSSALLTVRLSDGNSGTILVQEEGMARKPSILLSLSPTEILAYWARLTVEQRVQYLEERMGGLDAASLSQEGLDLLERQSATSMFETYAGIFHGFEMLRERVEESLAAGQDKQADYLLFGERHDSLPRLLHRVLANEDEKLDAVSRYLMVLSARQLVRWLKRSQGDFVSQHTRDMGELTRLTEATEEIRAQLTVGRDHVAFLDWFEGQFLRRAPSSQRSERG
ncbi:MAG: hypothetical protein EXR78_09515 [Deltaproteobacteria bacterium]|nr:hypothetical protein [Deltaproteobacteria bacterium]